MIDALKQIIERHWGFRSFRPLQEPAMRAILEGRDSVVVMPTGGGKSLCYQAPAVLRGDTTVVVSPLIALMKDQVDNLRAAGVPAVQIDSSLTPAERASYEQDVVQGNVRLLFVSPERLVGTDFYQLLKRINVRTFAIDEAHCISHWGHDFRPEYRQMRRIKELFPQASVHAYTATATEQVRHDIAQQLALKKPEFLVGIFDRPNLNYRVLPRHDLQRQVLDVLGRHKGEAGIIYCIRRTDVDDLAMILKARGFKALPYHAGMSGDLRKQIQETFAAEKCDIIVATVAFGMGIDRSNIRFVLHTGMPKSIEHYQQETGRAGRDGLEAECVLLHSGRDFMVWKSIMERSAAEAGADPAFLAHAIQHLEDMDRYARGVLCRHKALSQYFGQNLDIETCAACDLCLGDTQALPDALIVAQKILSCVARLNERFGIGHVISVLRGEDNEKVERLQHHKLTTYGLLKDRPKTDLRDWIYQLISQKVLVQNDLLLPSGDTVPILGLNEHSWEVMKGQRQVRLLQLVRRKKGEKAKQSKAEKVSWEGVDRELFESLRNLRRDLAIAKDIPAYVVFEDRTLREMARIRPTTLEGLRAIYGVGDTRLKAYGQAFLERIRAYCQEADLAVEQAEPNEPPPIAPTPPLPRPRVAPAPPPETVPDALIIAQKILSCVAKVKGPFDTGHIIRILHGRDTADLRQLGHDKLSTFGLMREYDRDQLRDWIKQLIFQGLLTARGGRAGVLELNDESWQVLRGQRAVELRWLLTEDGDESEQDGKTVSWEGIDLQLYEALDYFNESISLENSLPDEVFPAWVLRHLARVRPSTLAKLRLISGVTDAKLQAHGQRYLQVIDEHCQARPLSRDQAAVTQPRKERSTSARMTTDREYAYSFFRRRLSIEEVMAAANWTKNKVCVHLAEFIEDERPASLAPWVADDVCRRVEEAARHCGVERLKPIYVHLGEKVPYEEIRLVLARLPGA